MPGQAMCRSTCLGLACALVLTGCGSADRREHEAGRQLVAQYHCGRCHAVPGVPGAGGTLAPPLAGFGTRSYIAGRVPNEDATLARFIADPQAVVPGSAMPAMGVGEADARRIAAYLRSLR